MNNMKPEETLNNVCPNCENHCPPDQLRCPQGMEYFGMTGKGRPAREQDPSKLPPDEAVLVLLRKCGHYLHHNVGHGDAVDSAALLSALSEEEKQTLVTLLTKCTKNW